MPILPDAQDAFEVTLIGTNQGQPWMNKLHFHTPTASTPTPADLQTFATAVASNWGSDIAPLCHPNVILTQVNVIDLSSRTSAVVYDALASTIPGTRTGTALPLNVACCVSETAQKRYRGGHPRFYVPAGVTADVIGGKSWNSAASQFLATANANVATFYTALDGLSIGGVAVDVVCISYWETPAHPPHTPAPPMVLKNPPEIIRVTNFRVRGRVDTQRRRLGKELA